MNITIFFISFISYYTFNIITKNEIIFIEDDESDGSLYFIDNTIKLYHINIKYNKDKSINKEIIFSLLPKYKNASYDNQSDYKSINLGMGHALLIKTDLYDDYIKYLKKNIEYENQFEHFYNAYCYWMKYAMKFLKNKGEKND